MKKIVMFSLMAVASSWAVVNGTGDNEQQEMKLIKHQLLLQKKQPRLRARLLIISM
jgi:hypothetical protein